MNERRLNLVILLITLLAIAALVVGVIAIVDQAPPSSGDAMNGLGTVD